MKILILIIVLAVAGFIIAAKRRSRLAGDRLRQTSKSLPRASRSSPYHAVALDIQSGACREAQALKGKRFLSSEAPTLPLPGCTSAECRCRFQHFEDRRAGRNRRSEIPRGSGMLDETGAQRIERRQGRDRRKGDDEDEDLF